MDWDTSAWHANQFAQISTRQNGELKEIYRTFLKIKYYT